MRDYRNVLTLLSSVLLPARATAAIEAPRARRSSPPAGMSALAVLLVGLMLVMWPAPRAMGQPCEPEWAEGVFGVRGMSQSVQAMVVFDDGTGEALYAGGSFSTAGGVKANCVARWDGSVWAPLGEGMDDHVHALTVFDDGTGEALYAGGRFATAGGVMASCVARWDGSAWAPLGDGVGGFFSASVRALTVFDDGTGPALYAGGTFSTAGGVDASGIARWDGAAWASVGTGIGTVNALMVFDDGTGAGPLCGGIF